LIQEALSPVRITRLEDSLNDITPQTITDTATNLLDNQNYVEVVMYPEEEEKQ